MTNPERFRNPIGAPIVTVANLKGGVGKSTTTLMLAEGLAFRYGLNILVLDFDAQANLSQLLLTEKGVNRALEDGQGISPALEAFSKAVESGGSWSPDDFSARLVSREANTISELVEADHNNLRKGWVSLIPSHFKLRFIEPLLERTPGPEWVDLPKQLYGFIQASLGPLRGQFDIVLIDCPPHVSALCRSALKLADYIVTPVIAEELSLWGLKQFVKWIGDEKTKLWLEQDQNEFTLKQFIVFTKYQSNSATNAIRTELRSRWQTRAFGSPIRYRIDIERELPREGWDSTKTFRRKYRKDVREDVEKLADDFARFINDREKTQWKKIDGRD